ncbi:MAG TPA: hypothetical protein VGI93_01535 [Steroidobacteraceae bacterium]|jgi:hypothetical protein
MNPHQLVREYVKRVARISPLALRLRKLGGEALADIVDRATARVCDRSVRPRPLRGTYDEIPYFIAAAPQLWLFFQRGPSDVKTLLLCHWSLDAARKQYEVDTDTSGGAPLDPKALKFDTEAEGDLARHSEAGQAFAMAPERLLEQEAQDEAEAAALEYRRHRLREAAVKYFKTLKRPHRRVFCAICPTLASLEVHRADVVNGVISARYGVAPATVSKIRAKLESLADEFQTAPPDASGPEPVGESAAITSIADEDLEKLRMPEVDDHDDISENILHGYAQRQDLSWLARDKRWSGGRRMYSDRALVTGNYRHRDWDDPARIAERDQFARRGFSDFEMRMLEKRSAEAGFDLAKVLRDLDDALAKRALDSMLANSIAPKRGKR